MKINLNSGTNIELLKLNEFYKLVNIGYNVNYVVQYFGEGRSRGDSKSISLKLIMTNESNFSSGHRIGDIINWYYTGIDGGYLEKL